MIIRMHLCDESFSLLLTGRKSVELRLFDSKRRRLNPGDFIVFESPEKQEFAVKITALYRFADFQSLFKEIPPADCGFLDMSAEDAAGAMERFYSEKEICSSGVLGIRVVPADISYVHRRSKQIKDDEFEELFPDGMK